MLLDILLIGKPYKHQMQLKHAQVDVNKLKGKKGLCLLISEVHCMPLNASHFTSSSIVKGFINPWTSMNWLTTHLMQMSASHTANECQHPTRQYCCLHLFLALHTMPLSVGASQLIPIEFTYSTLKSKHLDTPFYSIIFIIFSSTITVS